MNAWRRLKGTGAKWISVAVACTLFAGVMAGCGKSQTTSQGSEVKLADNSTGYPLECADTLKVWMPLNDNVTLRYSNIADTPFGKAWMEQTGVKAEFTHPTSGNESEQFNLLIASKEMPDIIMSEWYNVPGGPQKYINEKTILDLKDVIDQYAPNMKQYLSENSEVDKAVKTDEGCYYVFPFIRGDDKLTVSTGPIIRKDILDQLNLPVPETIDEWHTTLQAFKDNGITNPLSYQLLRFEVNGIFSGAFGAPKNFFIDDSGKVQYGPVQPGAREYLTTMNQWYKEGLLDQNISNIDQSLLDSNILNGVTAASIGFAGSTIGTYMNTMKEKDPNFNIVAAPNPSLVKGQVSDFGQKDDAYVARNSAAITTSCNNVELAARFLDYSYGEEGSMLFNFGVEGESYTMQDGKPVYTDLILDNQDGLSISQVLSHYMMMGSGPYVQDVRYIDGFYQYDQQKEALDVWGNTNAKKHRMPMTTYTSDESKKAAKITNEINTYVEEMWLKFIMGVEPLDRFDQYVQEINSMGLNELIGYNQAAIERYEKR